MNFLCKLIGHNYHHLLNTPCTLTPIPSPDTHEVSEYITAWFICIRCNKGNTFNVQLNNWKKGTEGKII